MIQHMIDLWLNLVVLNQVFAECCVLLSKLQNESSANSSSLVPGSLFLLAKQPLGAQWCDGYHGMGKH